mgnify:CR=1 FL=1
MAKRKQYDLVGYVYDNYNKINKYTEEEIIKIPGVTFKSLEDVDKFTAGFKGFYELSSSLDERYQNKTDFSIRVSKDDEHFYYQSVIYNNPYLVDIVNSLEYDKINTPSGTRTVKMYIGNNDLFRDAWNDVKNKILKKNEEWLYGVFGEKSSYTTLINRYIKGDTLDSETNQLLADLSKAFREYKVFRKYLTNKDKVNNKSIVSNINVALSNIPVKTDIKKEKPSNDSSYIPIDDKDEYEDVYDPDEYAFLSPEELEQMTGGPGNIFQGQNPKYSAGIGRKH